MTKIEWTHPPGYKGETLNPIVGCRPIGTGCLNCYAATMAHTRLANMPQSKAKYAGLTVLNNQRHVFNGIVRLDREAALKPLSWRPRDPRCVFMCSMGDVFYGNEADRRAVKGCEPVPFEFLDLLFAVMALTPQHRYLLLTKRPDRAAEYMRSLGSNTPEFRDRWDKARRELRKALLERGEPASIGRPEYVGVIMANQTFPLPNVAIGCSVSTQRDAEENIPHLLACPAAMRFVSYEPAVEAVDFTRLDWLGRGKTTVDALRSTVTSNLMGDTHQADPTQVLDWLIVGGESGPKARPFDLAWARSAIRQCKSAGVAYFQKQVGSKPEGEFVKCPHCGHIDEVEAFDVGGADPGNVFCIKCGKPEFSIEMCEHTFQHPHGGDWDEWPEDIRVREWPEPFFPGATKGLRGRSDGATEGLGA